MTRLHSKRFIGLVVGALVFLLLSYCFFFSFGSVGEARPFDPAAYKNDLETELKEEAVRTAQSQQFWERVEKLVDESKKGGKLCIEC